MTTQAKQNLKNCAVLLGALALLLPYAGQAAAASLGTAGPEAAGGRLNRKDQRTVEARGSAGKALEKARAASEKDLKGAGAGYSKGKGSEGVGEPEGGSAPDGLAGGKELKAAGGESSATGLKGTGEKDLEGTEAAGPQAKEAESSGDREVESEAAGSRELDKETGDEKELDKAAGDEKELDEATDDERELEKEDADEKEIEGVESEKETGAESEADDKGGQIETEDSQAAEKPETGD